MQSHLSCPSAVARPSNKSQKVRQMEAARNIDGGSRGLCGDVAPGRELSPSPSILPSVLDLTGAQSLRDTLVALLGNGSVLLDASAVERMSTPCAQVLLAAARAADLAGSSFQLVSASDVFRAALADLGLQAEFKKWMV